jgi:hypothetical protein
MLHSASWQTINWHYPHLLCQENNTELFVRLFVCLSVRLFVCPSLYFNFVASERQRCGQIINFVFTLCDTKKYCLNVIYNFVIGIGSVRLVR